MLKLKSVTTAWAPRLRSVMRAIYGFTFLTHGAQKLLGFPKPMPGGRVPIASFLGLTGTLELVGGTLILIGLFTRPTAFVLSGMMACAYFMVHAPQGFWPLLNGGELAVLYCFAYLYLAAAGGGPWSVDAKFRKAA